MEKNIPPVSNRNAITPVTVDKGNNPLVETHIRHIGKITSLLGEDNVDNIKGAIFRHDISSRGTKEVLLAEFRNIQSKVRMDEIPSYKVKVLAQKLTEYKFELLNEMAKNPDHSYSTTTEVLAEMEKTFQAVDEKLNYYDGLNDEIRAQTEKYCQTAVEVFNREGMTKSHSGQFAEDYHRTENVNVRIGSGHETKIKDLVEGDGRCLKFDDRPMTRNILPILIDQNYTTAVLIPFTQAASDKGIVFSDINLNRQVQFNIPDNFGADNPRVLGIATYQGKDAWNGKACSFQINFSMKFNQPFLDKVEKGNAMDSREFGVDSIDLGEVKIDINEGW